MEPWIFSPAMNRAWSTVDLSEAAAPGVAGVISSHWALWRQTGLALCLVVAFIVSCLPGLAQGPQNIEGKVIDARGKPVARAQLVLVRKGAHYRDIYDLTYAEGKSGADGTFRFQEHDLNEGWILARRPSSLFREFTVTRPFSMTPGKSLSLEIRLPANSASVSGLVLNDVGQPVYGAIVGACPPPGRALATPYLMRWDDSHGSANFQHAARSFLPYAITDDAGRFSIDNLPAEIYRIVSSADGYGLTQTQPMTIAPGERKAGLRLELSPVASIGGGQISGRVIDQAGSPVEHIPVTAFDDKGNIKSTTFSDPAGYYRLSHLDADNYVVAVQSTTTRNLSARRNVRVGTTRVNFKVSLRSVAGAVTLPGGKPLNLSAGIEASAADWPGTRETSASGSGNRPGSFVLHQLPPGKVTVTASAPGYREAVRTVDTSTSDLKDLNLELVPACMLKIKVIEETSGAPLKGVSINVVETINNEVHWRYAGVTGDDGSCIDKDVRPGSNRVVAINPNHDRNESQVFSSPGKPVNVTLKLDRSSLIVGSIEGPHGRPLPGGKVEVEAVPVVPFFLFLQLKQVEGVYPGDYSHGRFTIRVPKGKYTVRARVELPYSTRPQGAPLLRAPSRYTHVVESRETGVGRRKVVTVNLAVKGD